MFISGACADAIVKRVLPEVTVSSMGLMDLNNCILAFLDKITNNIAPLVEMKADEVELALPNFLPESLIEQVKTEANKAVKEFTESGKKIDKCPDDDFPLHDLLTRLREKYHTVRINDNAVIYMAACIEFAVAEFAKVAGNRALSQGRKQINKMDIKYALQNDYEIGPCFQ